LKALYHHISFEASHREKHKYTKYKKKALPLHSATARFSEAKEAGEN